MQHPSTTAAETRDAVHTSEQERYLADARAAVKQQAFFMHRAIDSDNLREVFKYSSAMLGELRTSLLSPQKYYELYMRTFDELRTLEMFFEEQRGKGHTACELYELVQHAGNVLPRLYLLLTVGSVYIRSMEAPIKAVLKDMVEMCCGVQHPVRGLFLRSYLTQIARQGLMLIEEKGDDGQSNTDDAIEFLLQNFTEMNKLWVRMQHQGPVRERAKRERERQELRDLVGKNLVMLSQLDGVDGDTYAKVVLPRILEQITSCKDELAQNYLMDCVIQVFPDDFHIDNLETFLNACGDLHPSADVSAIICGLVQRLANFLEANPANAADFEQRDAFSMLLEPVSRIGGTLEQSSAASVYEALLDFVMVSQKGSDGLGRVDTILAHLARALQGGQGDGRGTSPPSPSGELSHKASQKVISILTMPLDTYHVSDLLDLGSYPKVMQLLSRASQKQVAVNIVQKILKAGTPMGDESKVRSLFDFISLLLGAPSSDGEDASPPSSPAEEDDDDLEEEQNLVARLVHQLGEEAGDPASTFAILQTARDRFAQGGPMRLKHTLPPVVMDALQLVKRVHATGGDAGLTLSLFQFLHATIDMIAEVPQPERALQLYLECALASDGCMLEAKAYDFMTAALDVYENSIPDTKAQVEALALLVGTLNACCNFGEDNWDTLVTTATKWSIKLLKKSDQCRAVYSCSHLFWRSEGQSGAGASEKVLVCLKRALTIARQAQGISKSARGDVGPTELFIAILNKYLYFFDRQSGEDVIQSEDVQNLLDLVSNETSSMQSAGAGDGGNDATLRYYHNTLRHIMHLKDKSPEKYAKISLKT